VGVWLKVPLLGQLGEPMDDICGVWGSNWRKLCKKTCQNLCIFQQPECHWPQQYFAGPGVLEFGWYWYPVPMVFSSMKTDILSQLDVDCDQFAT